MSCFFFFVFWYRGYLICVDLVIYYNVTFFVFTFFVVEFKG